MVAHHRDLGRVVGVMAHRRIMVVDSGRNQRRSWRDCLQGECQNCGVVVVVLILVVCTSYLSLF